MKISVLGAGAIGGLIGGYLCQKGEDVTLITREDAVRLINERGLKISGVRADVVVSVSAHTQVVEKPDLVILGTKTQDIECAISENYPFIKDSLILTTQNGVQADAIVSARFPAERIISSIVMFGATYLEPGKIVHNFEGSWVIGSMFSDQPNKNIIEVSLVLDKAFEVIISEKLRGMKFLKVFVNANNCIPALLGCSMQEAFSDVRIAAISIALWKEGLDVISKADIELVSLPGFPAENVTKLTRIDHHQAAQIFSGIMTNLSKDPLYGSVYQSIQRGRSSEIDYINGEFVRIAESNGDQAPLNKKLVELVHMVEQTKRFYEKEELLSLLSGHLA